MIGVVVPFFTNPSAVERLRGIVAGLEASPYDLALFDVESPDRQRRAFDTFGRGDRAEACSCLARSARCRAGTPRGGADPLRARRRASPRPADRPVRRCGRRHPRHPPVAGAQPPAHRIHRRRAAGPLPVPLEPRSNQGLRAGAGARGALGASRLRARRDAEPTCGAEHRGGLAASSRASHGDLRSVRHAGPWRARGGAGSGRACPGRALRCRLRRRRGCLLHGSHHRAPAAVRERPAWRRAVARRARGRVTRRSLRDAAARPRCPCDDGAARPT